MPITNFLGTVSHYYAYCMHGMFGNALVPATRRLPCASQCNSAPKHVKSRKAAHAIGYPTVDVNCVESMEPNGNPMDLGRVPFPDQSFPPCKESIPILWVGRGGVVSDSRIAPKIENTAE